MNSNILCDWLSFVERKNKNIVEQFAEEEAKSA